MENLNRIQQDNNSYLSELRLQHKNNPSQIPGSSLASGIKSIGSIPFKIADSFSVENKGMRKKPGLPDDFVGSEQRVKNLFGDGSNKPTTLSPSTIDLGGNQNKALDKVGDNVRSFLGDGRTNPVADNNNSVISVGNGKGTMDFGSKNLNDKYQSKINNSKGTLSSINLDNHGQFQLGERIKSIGARQRSGEISVAQAQEEMRMAKAAFSEPQGQGGYQESSYPDPRQNLLATILSTKGGERRAAIKAYELANKQFGDLAQRGSDSSQSQYGLNADKQRSQLAGQKLSQDAKASDRQYKLNERESGRADEELGLKIKGDYFENFITQLQGTQDPGERSQLIDALLLDREADEY